MKDINKKISELICNAQIASDAGKGIYELKFNNTKQSFSERGKYKVKDIYISKALYFIRKNKTSFNYYIEEKPDQNGYPSYITYFETKIESERIQISFHSPKRKADEMIKQNVGTGRKCRWDKNTKSSRLNCKKLIDYYNL